MRFSVLEDVYSVLSVRKSVIPEESRNDPASGSRVKFYFKDVTTALEIGNVEDIRGTMIDMSSPFSTCALDSGIFRGYLLKRSRKDPAHWKRRWCILHDNTLVYRKDRALKVWLSALVVYTIL